MKKHILTLSFLLFTFYSFSQNGDFRFGLEFTNGIGFVKSDNEDIMNTKAGYSFNYGIIVDYYFGKNYGISSGFQVNHSRYSRTNSPYMDNFVSDTANFNYTSANNLMLGQKEIYKLTYLDIPLTFKLRTNEIGYFRYFGEFGVVNSIRVRSRLDIEGSEVINQNINKKFEPLGVRSGFYNASLKVGGGFEYTISDKTAVLVELSYNNGFINVLKDGDSERSVLRIVNLTTGIMF